MKALDLFCGGGGAAMGLKLAGFDVIGVDINKQPEYPFITLDDDVLALSPSFLKEFDFIWASPPCQRYSVATAVHRMHGKEYPDLVAPTRELLLKAGVPYCIENVPNAPIRKDLMLCGQMFRLGVLRHRIFECHGFRPGQKTHIKHVGTVARGHYVGVYNGVSAAGTEKARQAHRRYIDEQKNLWVAVKDRNTEVCGHVGGRHGNSSIKSWQEAMGINHITKRKTLAEAVPPAYSEYIGREFLRQI